MKKIVLIILTTIFLVSCSSKSPEDTNVKTDESISAYDKAKSESKKLVKEEKVSTETDQSIGDSTSNETASNENNKPSEGENKIKYTICIDPGHQKKQITAKEPIAPGSSVKKPGVSSGATGVSTKKTEYQLNLEVSMIMKKKLEDKGYNVVMTRTSNDVSLSNIKRAEIGNSSNANLVVRIHADSNASQSVSGYSVLYPSGEYTKGIQGESKKASEFIEKKIKEHTGASSRGIIPRSDMTGFNWSKVPSIIVEMGFLSNPKEDKLMSEKSYQDKIANGIISGIEEYLKNI